MTDHKPAFFDKDVSDHRMTIIMDSDGYRHLRFARTGSSTMAFEIVTWPGYLAYTGDMGDFVFKRLSDMFSFFRPVHPGHTSIDYRYWAEKLVSVDREGYKRFSADLFRANIDDWLMDVTRELSERAAEDLRDEVAADVLSRIDGGRDAVMAAADSFQFQGRHIFQDFYEVDCDEWTHRFLWCCHALRWAIKKYDDERGTN